MCTKSHAHRQSNQFMSHAQSCLTTCFTLVGKIMDSFTCWKHVVAINRPCITILAIDSMSHRRRGHFEHNLICCSCYYSNCLWSGGQFYDTFTQNNHNRFSWLQFTSFYDAVRSLYQLFEFQHLRCESFNTRD